MARVIAVANQKGGVGKTTTVINLGAWLGDKGKKVLCVDMDPQANLTTGLGVDFRKIERSVYDVLVKPKMRIESVVIETKCKGLDLAPSHINLSGAEIELVPMYGREAALSRSMGLIGERYDFIFIDCPPSLSLLTVNALTTARELLITMQPHPFAMDGLDKLFETFDIVRDQLNDKLSLLGVVVTMYDARTNISKKMVEEMKRHKRLAGKVFKTIVPSNVTLADSQREGVPITRFSRSCPGAKAYEQLCEEFLNQVAR